MPAETLFIVCLLICTAAIWQSSRPKRRSQFSLSDQDFPIHWQELIEERVPLAKSLPLDFRRRHQRLILNFLTEKTFVGQGGFVVTEEIKIIIAAQACLLVLGRSGPIYPLLDTLHIFHGPFEGHLVIGDNVELDIDHGHVVGLTWLSGPMALAWDHAAHGAYDPNDGHNVVFHEFAHQLDMESGFIDGIPVMSNADAFAEWSQVMQREHQRLKTSIALANDRGENPEKTSLINPYGAHGLEEFFAVATETFFENSGQLKMAHPELYEQFRKYYNLDPVMWAHGRPRLKSAVAMEV